MPPPLRLLVFSDDAVARAGLRALAEAAGFSVIGESAAEDLPAAAVDEADAAVWDLGSSGELEALRAASGRVPVVAVLWSEEQAREALGAGARGVLRRDGLDERLAPAVRAAVAGLVSVESSLAEVLAAPRARSAEIVEALTPRESEVLQLLAEGFTNRRIGERLKISEHTVKFHVNSILGKLGAQTRGEAIAQAARLGLLLL